VSTEQSSLSEVFGERKDELVGTLSKLVYLGMDLSVTELNSGAFHLSLFVIFQRQYDFSLPVNLRHQEYMSGLQWLPLGVEDGDLATWVIKVLTAIQGSLTPVSD
jgi:hypothetical protein